MRILLTGGTGFLGKQVLEQLLANESITEVIVTSRRRNSHPNPRVKLLKADLTQPGCLGALGQSDKDKIDQIIHLAGLYDFAKSFTDNYIHNVIACSNVLAWMKALPNEEEITVHLASTYAVGAERWKIFQEEEPLRSLPSEESAYARTKAMVEQAVMSTAKKWVVYRLGILVGHSQTGHIEKIDGPYYIMRALYQVADSIGGLLKRVPIPVIIPADPKAHLPFVPVDDAASVLVEGVTRSEELSHQILGVYDSQNVRVDEFINSVTRESGLKLKPIYRAKLGSGLLRAQETLTKIPPVLFHFSSATKQLSNANFREKFGNNRITPYSSYEKIMQSGFHSYISSSRGAV